VLSLELRGEIDALWNKLWAGGLPNPLVAIDQLNLLLFLRRLEQSDAQRQARSRERGEPFESIFAGDAESCRWSWWTNLPAAEMFVHVQQNVIPWMRSLGSDEDPATQNLVRDAALIVPSAGLLAEAVATIERLHITDRNVDTQGDIYEYMLVQLQTAGALGQFRTPRHIIRAIVEMVDPRIGERVLDPACGTGGFLIAAHQHVLAAGTSPELLSYDDFGAPEHLLGDLYSEQQWSVLRSPPLTGLDVDPQLVRIATMNLVFHGIESPAVLYRNALGKDLKHVPQADVILANPPFAGQIDKDAVSEEFKTSSKKTELLFLELFSELLVPGGRAGIVVPEGVLFNSQAAFVSLRERILRDNTLEAVVSLPAGAFRPYTGSSCAILVFQRGGSTGNVWMFDVRADGFSLDDKRSPVAENDLPDLLARWPDKEDSELSFTVTASEIAANDYDLSVDTYAPFELEPVDYGDPVELISKAEQELESAIAALEELKRHQ
jgi:type I restriction enzyme M protein